MDNDRASDQQEPVEVTDNAQPPHSDTPVKTSGQPVRRKPATPRSQSERLLGVKDPEPELTERPVGRKRSSKPAPTPRPKPVTYLLEGGGAWDDDFERIGHALAAELAGGAE